MDLSPVPAREHSIVWEIRPEEARGALFDFGADQTITLRRTWRASRGAPLPSFLKLKQFRKVRVIVALHPSLAQTFILPFRLSRKKLDPPIPPENLQTMLQEFLAKSTFEMRRRASAAFGVEELDAILLDARLASITVDGADVREGEPVKGRRIEGFLHVTFTTRAVFHDLHDLLHSGRELFFTERGVAALAFLGRHSSTPLTLLDMEAQGGWLFHIDHDADEVVKKTSFRWSAEAFPQILAETWSLSRPAADKAYELFLSGELSEDASRFAKRLFEPLEESFGRALAKTKAGGKMHVRAAVPVPTKAPGAAAGIDLAELPLASLLKNFGLTFDLAAANAAAKSTTAETSFFLLPLLEYYYHRGDPEGHRALTRHIHWISA